MWWRMTSIPKVVCIGGWHEWHEWHGWHWWHGSSITTSMKPLKEFRKRIKKEAKEKGSQKKYIWNKSWVTQLATK